MKTILDFLKRDQITYFSWFGLLLAVCFCDKKKSHDAFFLKDGKGKKTENTSFFEAVLLLKEKKQQVNNTYHLYMDSRSLKRDVCLVSIELLAPTMPKTMAYETIENCISTLKEKSEKNRVISHERRFKASSYSFNDLEFISYDLLGGYHLIETLEDRLLNKSNRSKKISKKPAKILMQKTAHGRGIQVLSLERARFKENDEDKVMQLFARFGKKVLKNWDYNWKNSHQNYITYVSQFKKAVVYKVSTLGITHHEDIRLDTEGQELTDFSPSEINIPFWLPWSDTFHFGLLESKIVIRDV